MATTQNTYTGNGSLTEYSFTFPYLEESDVKVSLDGVDQATSEYSFANATTISFNTAPANGVAIRIYRQTAQDAPPATFFAGSAIRASDLNENFLQTLYVAQETDQIARNLTAGDIAPGSITNVQLAADAVTTVKIADLNVTTDKLANSAVTSAKIADGTIVNADVNASAAIAGTKVSPDFGSQNITTTGDVSVTDATITGTAIISGLTYPTSDGASDEVLKTNGSGGLSWRTVVSLSNAEDGAGTDFKFNSGYGSNATAYGCRSWVRFNGDGTPTRLGNGNVSSITDRGTGRYTVNFTTSHPDANYTFAGATSTSSNGDPNHLYMDDGTGQAAGSLAVNTARGLDGAIQDARNVYIVTFR